MDFAGRRQRQAALGSINLEFIAAIICLRNIQRMKEREREMREKIRRLTKVRNILIIIIVFKTYTFILKQFNLSSIAFAERFTAFLESFTETVERTQIKRVRYLIDRVRLRALKAQISLPSCLS